MTKKTETIATIDYAKENQLLLSELTKRNEQYMFELDKALKLTSMTDTDRERVQYDMMSELVVAQKKGVTARQLYGTVTKRVQTILDGPKEDLSKPSPDWQLLIDGGLMLGSLFMIISGFNNVQQQGIVGLLLNYVFSAFAMLMITKSSPRYVGQMTFKNKSGILKYILFTVLGMLVWMGGMVGVTTIPLPFNVVLPGVYYIGIGVVTLLLRFYLKKVWKIRGTVF